MNGKSERILDGATVGIINADLTSGGLDLTKAKVLKQNAGRAFQGTISYGPFEIEGNVARDLIALPRNPNGRPNSDVVRPWTNGQDITKRSQDFWIIFFPDDLTEEQAALYEAPFELVSRLVKPARAETENKELNKKWWKLWRTRPEYFKSSAHLERVIVTPRVSKHRLFVWRAKKIVPDSATVVIVRDDDTSFGVLHSRFHELWTLRMCTFLGVGNDPRYTPSSTFDTFPFPEGLTPDIAADCFSSDPRALAIALKAKRLDELREAWLNPLELIDRQPEVVSDLPARLIPKDDAAAKVLRKRTLTKLYNDRPQWLSDAHKALDAAVAAAYGWPNDLTDDEVLARLFALNQERAAAEVQSN
jgi:type II restriction/modification system DNA methylase subunit YeeA